VIGLLVAAFACAGGAAVLGVTGLRGRRTAAALSRVAAYGRGQAPVEAAASEPDRQRRLAGLRRAAASVTVAIPGRDRERTALQLVRAGFAQVDPDTFLATKALATVGGGVLGALAGSGSSPATAILFALLLAAAGWLAPDLLLTRRAERRRDAILRELPNALDLLAVIVEAGLGFDAALLRYAERAEGPLAEEIALLAAELRIGGSRADAFKRLTERISAPEVVSFTRSLIHADQLGTSLSATLRTQAADARVRRRVATEERANKLPVKMLFPTVFCIFPALFVVVLGPPMLALVQGLK